MSPLIPWFKRRRRPLKSFIVCELACLFFGMLAFGGPITYKQF